MKRINTPSTMTFTPSTLILMNGKKKKETKVNPNSYQFLELAIRSLCSTNTKLFVSEEATVWRCSMIYSFTTENYADGSNVKQMVWVRVLGQVTPLNK